MTIRSRLFFQLPDKKVKENTEGKSPVEDDEKLSKEKKKVEKEGTFEKDWDWCNVHLVFSLHFLYFQNRNPLKKQRLRLSKAGMFGVYNKRCVCCVCSVEIEIKIKIEKVCCTTDMEKGLLNVWVEGLCQGRNVSLWERIYL